MRSKKRLKKLVKAYTSIVTRLSEVSRVYAGSLCFLEHYSNPFFSAPKKIGERVYIYTLVYIYPSIFFWSGKSERGFYEY